MALNEREERRIRGSSLKELSWKLGHKKEYKYWGERIGKLFYMNRG